MNRKKVLFVIDSLQIGGAEKSLVSLLQLFDYDLYDIDLQLFRLNGDFERFLPDAVNILPLPEPLRRLSNSFLRLFLIGDFSLAISRIRYSIAVRIHRLFSKETTVRWYNEKFWRVFSNYFMQSSTKYDYAIAYSQGMPTYYVVDKVVSPFKIGWINVYYNLSAKESRYQEQYYSRLNSIVLVSNGALEEFRRVFPQFSSKMIVIHDICNAGLLQRMSNEANTEMDMSVPRLLTVSRLDKMFKGLDISLLVAEELVKRKISFNWYFVGDGKDRTFMVNNIKNHCLDKYVHLLGARTNPYPYFKNTTLYVQTSRQEGWGISLVEARLFNKPIITTEFGTVWNQMVQGKNGIVTSFEPSDIADAIQELLYNSSLMLEIKDYLSKEKKGNLEEFNKVVSLLS